MLAPFAPYQRIYLFSVKNPKEVENNRKPHLEEVGPFTYSEETERINEEFSEVNMQVLCLCSPFGGRGPILLSLNFCFQDGSYVSYETRKIWHYIPEESLPLDTMVSFTK